MGTHLAAFYSPDDDLEHALQLVSLPSIGPTAFLVSDTTFSPAGQGNRKLLDTLAAPTYEAVVALSGVYSPLDGLRYAFVATSNNQIYATAYKQDSTKPEFGPVLVYDTPFPSYPPHSIVDIAAFFSSDSDPALDNQIYIAVLMANGDLWAIFGTHDVIGSWTAIGLLFAHAPQGKNICAYYSPQDQERHMLIATDHDITHVHFTSHSTQQEALAHFDETILAISGFYTPDDQMQHSITATTDGSAYHVQEIVFQLGIQIPPTTLLGTVNFTLLDIGAYVKPDAGRHVIMVGTTGNPYPNDTQLYLSWYYPGWQGFAYGPWPTLPPWYPKILDFEASPTNAAGYAEISAGDSVTLSWQVASFGAQDTKVWLIGWRYNPEGDYWRKDDLPLIGNLSVTPPVQTLYSLWTNTPSLGGTSDMRNLWVFFKPGPAQAKIVYFTAAPNDGYINLGTAATLSWQITDSQADTKASLQGRVGLGGSGAVVLNLANVSLQGSQSVTPGEDTRYTLTVTDSRGQVSQAKWVTVYAPPTPPPGSVFYFKMTNAQSQITPCFTLAIYAKDKETAKAMAEQQNGGYKAESIDASQFMTACG